MMPLIEEQDIDFGDEVNKGILNIEEIDISEVPKEFRSQFEEAERTGERVDITIPPDIDKERASKSLQIGNILNIPSSQAYDNVDIYEREIDRKKNEHLTEEAQVMGGDLPFIGSPANQNLPEQDVFVSPSEFYDPEFRINTEKELFTKGKRPNLIVKRKVSPEHSLVAVPEGIMSFVTGFGSAIAGGVSGLVNGIIKGDAEVAGQTLENVSRAMTYEPRTEAGQRSAEILNKPFELVLKGLEFVGNETWETLDKKKTEQLEAFKNLAIENPEKMMAKNNLLQKDFASPAQYAQEMVAQLEIVPPEVISTGVVLGTAFLLSFLTHKSRNIPQQIKGSQWWRELTVKERGLVTISNERMIQGLKESGISEGQIARKLKAQGMPEYFNELNKQRIKGEKSLSEIIKTPEQVEGTLGELIELKFDRQAIRKKIIDNKLAKRDAFEGVSQEEIDFIQKEALKERAVEPVSKDRIKELEDKKINSIDANEATELVIEGKNIESHLEEGMRTGKDVDIITNDLRELMVSKLAEDKTLRTSEKTNIENKLVKQIADAYEKFLIGEKPEVKPVEKKPSKIGKSIETKAIEAKLTEGFSETAGYEPITIKEQAKLASDLINSDIEQARAVVRGEAELPEKLKGTALITAMEEHIKRNPESAYDLAYELANSPLVAETSAAAQELRLAAERVPDSATAKLREIKKAKEAEVKELPKKRKAVKKQIKVETEKMNLTKEELSWDRFLDKIVC